MVPPQQEVERNYRSTDEIIGAAKAFISGDRCSAFIREMRAFLLKTAGAGEISCGKAVAETKTAPRSGVSRRTAEPPLSADELFRGMSVAHKSFGGGRVVSFDRKFLEVFFPERNETKRFVLDFTLQNRLLKAL